MNLFITKKLANKLKLSPPEKAVDDEFLTWRANYVQGSGFRFVSFMNDASRFNIVINEAKVAKLKKLPELFIQVLSDTLLMMGVNPEIIDRYINDLGDITYAKNSDRKKTAQLNANTRSAWWALRDYTADVDLSVEANRDLYNTSGIDEVIYPKEKMLELLCRYGLPVRKTRAFDLNVRLDLDGNDAVRKLRVPASMTFEKLHSLLQTAFGWRNYHLHDFGLFKEWSDNYYAKADVELVVESKQYDAYESNPDAISVAGVKLSDYVPEYTKILYRYDFGDDWHHYIEVEGIIDDCEDSLPILLSGEGDTPPEDVGGTGGYAEFVEVIADPEHEDYEHLTQWAKSQWWMPFDFDRTARMINGR